MDLKMTKDEALRIALEALERSVATCLDPYSHEQVMSRPEHFINQTITAIEAALETKDEPVAIVISESGANVTHSWWHEPALPIGTKLYTSPQRTWVGLTDDEVYKIAFALEGEHWRKIADTIEAKLKEKNT